MRILPTRFEMVLILLSGITATLIYASSWRVPPGHRGVLVLFGAIRPELIPPGLHFAPPWPLGLVRMVPPVLAAAVAVLGAVLFPERGEGLELPVLLVSACLGYLAGAVWMRLAFQSAAVPDAAGAAATDSSCGHGLGGIQQLRGQRDVWTARVPLTNK